MPPTVSVVMPIYDRTDMLDEAIKSVLHQTYRDFELILVTDGSPKDTLAVVERHVRDNPVDVRHFRFLNNSGSPARGRNKGIREARGKYVAFLDSDDIAFHDRLQASVAVMEAENADVVYGDWIAKVEGSHPEVTDGQYVNCPTVTLPLLLRMNALCQSTVMAKRDALIAVGGVRQDLRYLEDWELWVRLASQGYKFAATGHPLCRLRLHAGNAETRLKPDFAFWRNRVLDCYQTLPEFPLRIVYLTPGDGLCGGVAVILQHVNRLLQRGHDVSLATMRERDFSWFPNNQVECCHADDLVGHTDWGIDALVATGWETVGHLPAILARRKYYFVQSDERRFTSDPTWKHRVHATYQKTSVKYFTEGKWLKKWLNAEFGHEAAYVPNGIDLKLFYHEPRTENPRPRVLIEGPVILPWKGVEDCYRAVEPLDCDIWLVSSCGTPDPAWRIDRAFEAVPLSKMRSIYGACDVFLKMSLIEGVFRPPLEAMACGVPVVVAECTGVDEYVRDGENALVVPKRDIVAARAAVSRILGDRALRQRLIGNGLSTAGDWPWEVTIAALEGVLRG